MYTYGPVPSRRLGSSLGVSPIPPKTCSYTCVYCQLGRTTRLQIKRESFFPKEEILSEIIRRSENTTTPIDYVTFVGDGEPILCKDLGWLITQTKDKLKLPVAVITNGSLLFQEDVRHDLINADVVLPTLDAGNEKTYRAVNRPHRSLNFDLLQKGLIKFRKEYHGQLWLEVMLVEGLNDTEEELQSIKKSIDLIKPNRVYIVTPIRPPAESWVKPPKLETIINAQYILGTAQTITNREQGSFGINEFKNSKEAILEIGSRHPLRYEQAIEIEKEFSDVGTVDVMLKDKELVLVQYNSEDYILPSRFIRDKKKK